MAPSGTTVKKTIFNLLDEEKKNILADIVDVLNTSGGVSCDGRKVDTTVKKYYDFIVSFFDIRRFPGSQRYSWTLN